MKVFAIWRGIFARLSSTSFIIPETHISLRLLYTATKKLFLPVLNGYFSVLQPWCWCRLEAMGWVARKANEKSAASSNLFSQDGVVTWTKGCELMNWIKRVDLYVCMSRSTFRAYSSVRVNLSTLILFPVAIEKILVRTWCQNCRRKLGREE